MAEMRRAGPQGVAASHRDVEQHIAAFMDNVNWAEVARRLEAAGARASQRQ